MARSFDIAMFDQSDGLTPIQTRKLNQNFQSLLSEVSSFDENSGSSIRLARSVQDKVVPMVMDMVYPVGSIVLAKGPDSLPEWGKWREVQAAEGRFVRIANAYGGTGGSASATVAFRLPRHRHGYTHDGYGTVLGGSPATGNVFEYMVDPSPDLDQRTTGWSGEESPSTTVDTIPPYYTLRLYERYE